MRKINIWAERHAQHDITGNYSAFYSLIENWKKIYPNVVFERKTYIPSSERKNIHTYKLQERKFIHNGWNSSFHFIIENDDTKKYFLVTYWDLTRQSIIEFKEYDYDNLVEVFTAQGSHDPDDVLKEDTTVKYTPLNKVLWLVESEKEIEKIMKNSNYLNTREIPEKLFCRVGTPYLFRTYLQSDSRFNFKTGNRVPEKQHILELSKNLINMDVYSVSGVSMRLIEGFGLGTAVLSPVFPQRTTSPIIPDFHYIKVEFNDKLISKNYNKLANAYIETFERVKKDKDLIHYIGSNARNYYKQNCTVEEHTKNLLNVLDLAKLL
jgi:hypothetical protein